LVHKLPFEYVEALRIVSGGYSVECGFRGGKEEPAIIMIQADFEKSVAIVPGRGRAQGYRGIGELVRPVKMEEKNPGYFR